MENDRGEMLKASQRTVLEKRSLEDIFTTIKNKGLACAVYQLPKSTIKQLIIDLSSGSNLNHLQLDEMGSGFIFHPFSADRHEIKFINRDIHIVEKLGSKELEIKNAHIAPEELLEMLSYQNGASEKSHATSGNGIHDKVPTDHQKSEFLDLINKAIAKIKTGAFQKAVVSRNKTIELPAQFNSFEFFDTLTDQYRNAFVYMSFIPDTGTWIGATPETLIRIDPDRQFQTVALAATQAYRNDIDLEDMTWSQKDIEEQAMVSRYIINCFKKIRLREFEEVGPRTHLSGNLIHLKTEYNVDMDQVAFPELGSVMLELLHPTSAVCGMPKEPAKDFIEKHEGFDREYFSGFLGPVNMQNETNIFVNLRCLKLMQHQARLYAGAGIISNSNPEKEWNETEIKIETLLKVLKELY